MMARPSNYRTTTRPKKRLLKDEEYCAVIRNHQANFDTKINNIIQKYSQPNVDKRVIDLVSQRFMSSDEDEPHQEPQPPCKSAFRSGTHPVNTPFDESPPIATKSAKARSTCRAVPCHLPVLSFRGRYLSTLRKQRLRYFLPMAPRICERRVALSGCQPETRKEVLRRSTRVCGTGKEKQTVTSVGQTVLTPVHVGRVMSSPACISQTVSSTQPCKKNRKVIEGSGSRIDGGLCEALSAWHSIPRSHQRQRESPRSKMVNGAYSPASDRLLHGLSSVEQSPIEVDKLHSRQLSDIDKFADDSSGEFLLLSDFEDLADTSGSPPRPCAMPTFSRSSHRNRPACRRSLVASWDCQPPIQDSELPADMFDVVIVDNPKLCEPVACCLMASQDAGAPAKVSDPPATDRSPVSSCKSSPVGSCKSSSSRSSELSSCCVLLHYDKGSSTQVIRVSGSGRSQPIYA